MEGPLHAPLSPEDTTHPMTRPHTGLFSASSVHILVPRAPSGRPSTGTRAATRHDPAHVCRPPDPEHCAGLIPGSKLLPTVPGQTWMLVSGSEGQGWGQGQGRHKGTFGALAVGVYGLRPASSMAQADCLHWAASTRGQPRGRAGAAPRVRCVPCPGSGLSPTRQASGRRGASSLVPSK